MPAGMNPLFEIPELPPLVPPPHSTLPPLPGERRAPKTQDVSLALIKTTSLVPSVLSPTGYVKVKKFAWTARIVRVRAQLSTLANPYSKNNPFGLLGQAEYSYAQSQLPHEMGDGWLGEWVLEYEGTSEGREFLLAALEGKHLGSGMAWEVRRERSGGGRIWMR